MKNFAENPPLSNSNNDEKYTLLEDLKNSFLILKRNKKSVSLFVIKLAIYGLSITALFYIMCIAMSIFR